MKLIKAFATMAIAFTFLHPAHAQSIVTIYSNKGAIAVRMYDTIAPITSGNFMSLVKKKFYDGIIFHRVINNFMIQGGDPNGNGTGGPGYVIPDEFSSQALNIQKSISMANAGPNTGGSQFFINLVNNPHLNYKHAVFGICVDSLSFAVVQAIGKVPVSSTNKPITPVIMDSVRITYDYHTGMNDPETTLSDLRIIPNPMNASGIVTFNSRISGEVTATIHDLLGREMSVVHKQVQGGPNLLTAEELGQAGLPEGIYQLTLTCGSLVSKQKFMISR